MATIYVNKTGNDSNDGSTPALAKLTIGAALTAASNDDTIDIGAGTYSEEITCGSLTGVTIQGATGQPEDVIITSNVQGTPTVKMYDGCILKDLTVLYNPSATPSGAGYLNTFCIIPVSSTRSYHIDNCIVKSTRNGMDDSKSTSTINRTQFEYVGARSACPVSGNAGYGGSGNTNTIYQLQATGQEMAGIFTSCLFLNWPGHIVWRGSSPMINCTAGFKTSGGWNKYGIYSSGQIYNTISFMDEAHLLSVSTGSTSGWCSFYNGGGSAYVGMKSNSGNGYIHNSISHGWDVIAASYYGDWTTPTDTDNWDTVDVDAAGGLAALYIDYSTSNFRIRSGSLAYHTAAPAPSDQPVYDFDGKPFHPTTPSIGCYEYCFGHPAMGVSVRRTSGSLGVGSTLIGSMLGVTT